MNFDHLKTNPTCLKSDQFLTFCICIQKKFINFKKFLEIFWKNSRILETYDCKIYRWEWVKLKYFERNTFWSIIFHITYV